MQDVAGDVFHAGAGAHAAFVQVVMRFRLAEAVAFHEKGLGLLDEVASGVGALRNGVGGAHGVHLQEHADGANEFAGAHRHGHGEEVVTVVEGDLAALCEDEDEAASVESVSEFGSGHIAQFEGADDDAATHILNGAQYFCATAAAITHADAAVDEGLDHALGEGVVV